MNVLLDTTVQIDRIFKPKKREKIEAFLRENQAYCSTYVLGEFKENIVQEFATLYDIMQIEDNLTEVYQRIAEIYSSREKTRLIYMVNDLARSYGEDYKLIKESLEIYPERLIRRFYYGINKTLLNETKCARAKAELQEINGGLKLIGISCTKRYNQCGICDFWEKRKEKITGLEDKAGVPQKIVQEAEKLNKEHKIPKGNACRSMGDCIIALESLDLEDGMVASTNEKDFLPICQHIGATLVSIEKSNVYD